MAPAPSAVRRMAPRLRGSVTPSRASRNAFGSARRSSSIASGSGSPRAITPWAASVRLSWSIFGVMRTGAPARSASRMISSRTGAGSSAPSIHTSRMRRLPASSASRTARRPSICSPPAPLSRPGPRSPGPGRSPASPRPAPPTRNFSAPRNLSGPPPPDRRSGVGRSPLSRPGRPARVRSRPPRRPARGPTASRRLPPARGPGRPEGGSAEPPRPPRPACRLTLAVGGPAAGRSAPFAGLVPLRAHPRCQVVPVGVSSRVMPRAARSARMRSASAKSLALRAALRASTRALISSSPSPVCRAVVELQAEGAGQGVHGRDQAAGVGAAAGVDGQVALADGLVDGGQGGGRVEVVVEGGVEGGHRRRGRGRRGQVQALHAGGAGPAGQGVERGQGPGGGGDVLRAHLHVRAVVGPEDQQPQRPGAVGVDGLLQRGEVAERAGHLLAADVDHGVVEPVAGEALPGALRLGPLVLVVGEDEVHAAAVDVEAFAQQPDRHGRALDVPAGPARAPGRLPRRLAGLGRLPQGEVDRRALALVDLDPGAGRLQQVVEPAVGEVPVVGEALDREVHAGLGGVGPSGRHQLGHQVEHLGDELRWRGAPRAAAGSRAGRAGPSGWPRSGRPPRARCCPRPGPC